MSNRPLDSILGAQTVQTATGPRSSSRLILPPPFEEQRRPKLRGRHRLLAGLQRISSSPSIHRLAGRTPVSRYGGNGKGSISCISLTSAGSSLGASLGASLTSEDAPGFPTAPDCAQHTSGPWTPSVEERARVKYVSCVDGKTSVGVPTELRPRTPTPNGIAQVDEARSDVAQPIRDFNFWRDLPSELQTDVLSHLEPRDVIRCSAVSKAWHRMCFDGALWACLDTRGFYQAIPAAALVKIITTAGPFMRDLNLRGCVQLKERWHDNGLSGACENLENICLEGCRIDRKSMHTFLNQNSRLVHVNLCGLETLSNSALRIIASRCPRLEHLNVNWCKKVSTAGLTKVFESCHRLRDLRASETKGWGDVEFAQLVFERNSLERLVLMNCDDLTNESFAVMIEGRDSEIDVITGRPSVAPRKLKYLDLTRCLGITDQSVKTLVHNVPHMEGLQLSKLRGIVDATLTELLPTVPLLTHLDLEELEDLSNAVLQTLAVAPCASRLRHLSISYCEYMGDEGMLPVLQSCVNLCSLEMDNTRISDRVLIGAGDLLRNRSPHTIVQADGRSEPFTPEVGLRLIAYDCQNVTWMGVRGVLSRNSNTWITTHPIHLPPLARSPPSDVAATDAHPPASPRIRIVRSTSYPSQIIALKCFYTYQPTVEEHTKRVLRGDWYAARRLERKWAEFMMAQREASIDGSRRRRRRAREAGVVAGDEEGGGADGAMAAGIGGIGRRRARSGGCVVM